MAKNKKTVATGNPNKVANIIVGVVAGIAALIVVAVIVLCSVSVAPLDGVKQPLRYDFYNVGSTDPESTNDTAQSKIRNAMNDMEFSPMSAILQWNWDYSYNFVRNTKGEKIEMNADEIEEISATSTAFMVEYVYEQVKIENGEVDNATAQSLKVDGETIYFDRLKVVIDNSDGGVGELYLYPYIYDRVTNRVADGGVTRATYRITAVKVRANTTAAYAALGDLAQELSR